MSVDVSLVAEFPNDNPALHCGVIWVCLEPTGPAIAELVERPIDTQAPTVLAAVASQVATVAVPDHVPEPEPEPENGAPEIAAAPTVIDVVVPEEEILIEDLAPLEEVAETAGVIPAFDSVPPPSNIEESAPPPASDDPFTLLVCTLADVAIGAGFPIVAQMLPGLLFDGRVPEVLDDASANALQASGIIAGREVTPEFIATTAAWRAILRGQSDDFSACPSMLDEWTATLLAQLLGAERPRMRQELRSRGVAAFGLT